MKKGTPVTAGTVSGTRERLGVVEESSSSVEGRRRSRREGTPVVRVKWTVHGGSDWVAVEDLDRLTKAAHNRRAVKYPGSLLLM